MGIMRIIDEIKLLRKNAEKLVKFTIPFPNILTSDALPEAGTSSTYCLLW